MPASDLSPERIESFLAVARHLSFTRAAAEVRLSQSAVSRQVAQLERALGAKLFRQVGRAVELTDAGRAFGPHAERLSGDLARALEVVPALAAGRHGRLRIGASTTPGFYVLPPVVGEFHRRWPDVEIEYTVGNTAAIEQMLLRNEVDVGFVGAHLTRGELVFEPFAEDEIVCFAGPRHPLASKRRVAAADLARETLVTREEGSATRRLFDAWLAGAGVAIRRSVQLGCPEAIKALVVGGFGIGFLSRFGLADELARRRLAVLRIDAPPLRRPLAVVRHPHKETTASMRSFLSILRRRAVTGRGRAAPAR